jgi:hypothetical protein
MNIGDKEYTDTIIKNLFENTKGTDSIGRSLAFTYSRVNLTEEQINKLEIPNFGRLMNLFILSQCDDHQGVTLTTSDMKLIVFLIKDEYIYSYYLHVIGQTRFSINELTTSRNPIELSRTACFPYSQYFEIHDLTKITKKTSEPPYKMLGLSRNMKNI